METGNNQLKYVVYITTNVVNKKIYIGAHVMQDPEKWDGYLGCGVYANKPYTYNKPKHVFQYAVKKYGPKNFIWKIIKVFNTEKEMFDLEKELVNKQFLARKDVYNVALGGNGGDISHQAKMCYSYTMDGLFFMEYSSITEAGRSLKISPSTIKSAIVGRFKSNGFYWSFDKFDRIDTSLYSNSNEKKVYQYNVDGAFEYEYNSLSQAAFKNNSSTSNIHRAIVFGYLCNNKYFLDVKKDQFSKAKLTKLNSTPVYQYALSGDFIKEWKNAKAARIELNIKSDIGSAIRKGTTAGGFQWRYDRFDKIQNIEVRPGIARKVAVYDIKGNFIEEFNTVSECKKKYKSCGHVLSGKRKIGNNHIFKYID